ncbi:MAG TPA: SDR family NAD(P)-dependent oxidoreductase, partial [Blastocatellia bacterium]
RGRRANERIFADRLRRQAAQGRASSKLADAQLDRVLRKLIDTIRTRNLPSGPYTLPGLMPNVAASRIANMFNLNGPNIVIDMGSNSLVQSLFVARQLLAHDACKIVLAGAINANDPDSPGFTEDGAEDTEAGATFLLALATPESAQREGWPVLSTMEFIGPDEGHGPREQVPELDRGRNYKGAQGAPEILKAINQSRQQGAPWGVKHNAGRGGPLIFGPPALPQSPSEKTQIPGVEHRAYAYVRDTAIRRYRPQLTCMSAQAEPKSLAGRRILFLADQPDFWRAIENSGALASLAYRVVCLAGERFVNSLPVDLSSEESTRSSLNCLSKIDYDSIIAIKDLQGRTKDSLLLNDFKTELVWLDLLFAVCRSGYNRIKKEGVAVIAVCQGAYSEGKLDPYTGLVSGFMKSVARELGGLVNRAITTDETDVSAVLRQIEVEIGQHGGPAEVAYKEGTRNIFELIPISSLACRFEPYLDANSVVVATGGARGVTAVLVEEIVERFGCRVIALGRTDPSLMPEAVRQMSEREFQRYEAQFYKDELQGDKSRKITDLKRQYQTYQAANEVHRVIERLRAISDKYEYRSVDVTSAEAIDEIVEDAYRTYGRLDLVLHGAGIQMSNALTKKSLADFRGIIDTKLDGLCHLYRACRKHGNGRRTHFHVLTSAFSYLGNDGQPDYGAANEAMARIADCMNAPEPGPYWSSLGWLGWAGIGMTRGTEYAALAASRGLRGVTPEEGKQMFRDLIAGPPASAVNVLLADGEIAFYHPEIANETPATTGAPLRQGAVERVVNWQIRPEAMPFLSDHLVRGVPTVPGSFIIAMAAEAALKLLPGLKIVQFERTRFLRMVRAHEGRPGHVRALSKVVEQNGGETVVQVQILMDFVHKSGRVLGKDILHTEIYVRLAAAVRESTCEESSADRITGLNLPDPYLMDGSPVRLNGPFRTLKEVVVGRMGRRAEYKLNGGGYGSDFDYLIPNIILVDAFWRFGTVRANESGGLSVYVPERCDAMKVFFDYTEFGAPLLRDSVTFHGANPRPEDDVLHVGPINAFDSNGRLILRVEGGQCRKFGEVEAH